MIGKAGMVSPRQQWSPASLSPLAWYDAQTESTLTQASNLVSQWNDRGANGNNLTVESNSFRPLYSSTGLNSLPAVTSDASRRMECVVAGASGLTDKLSVFAVAKMASTGNDGRLAAWLNGSSTFVDDTSTPNAVLVARFGTDQKVYARRNSANRSERAVTYDTAHIIGSVFDGTNHTMYVDGVAGTAVATTGNFGNSAGTVLAIMGNYNTSPTYWHGAVGELIVIVGEVTAANRERIEGYLAHRWDLEGSLDAGHPYKSSAP